MDTFTKSMLETALWSSTDGSDDSGGEPMDRNYGIRDFSLWTLRGLANDAKKFQRENAKDLEGFDSGHAGHDFWLTRNGHGAGFWDGDYPEPQATRLTKSSKKFGEVDLYVGDDGKIYAGGYEGPRKSKSPLRRARKRRITRLTKRYFGRSPRKTHDVTYIIDGAERTEKASVRPKSANAKTVLGDARYGERHKFPKWNVEPTVLMEPRLMPRVFPEMTRSQHAAKALAFRARMPNETKAYNRICDAAIKKYGDGNGHLISGVYREHFPELVKEKLRYHAYAQTLLGTAAFAHETAARMRSLAPSPTSELFHPSRYHKELGEAMAPWAAGGDIVQQVASHLYAGKPFPREKLAAAAAQLSSWIPDARQKRHGWTMADARQLARMSSWLRNLYAQGPGERSPTRRGKSFASKLWSGIRKAVR